jgi:predicted transcriptional regulator
MTKKQNIIAVVIFALSCYLGWLVFKGTITKFDTAFGFVREATTNILLEKIALYFLIAGSIEIIFHVSIKIIKNFKMFKVVSLIAMVLFLAGCATYKCRPSKGSSDYATINNQDKIYH